jgi:hypothetical protein
LIGRRRHWGRRLFLAGEERGQVAVLFALFLVALMGLAALVLDLGSWSQGQRVLQSQADAAALAGAQDLPYDTQSAGNLAALYANKNGTSIPAGGISFSTGQVPNDSISVKLAGSAPGFFARVFGIQTVQLHAHATAESDLIGQARYVAPITVRKDHPMLSNPGCPCFTQETSIPLGKNGAPGSFGLINLDGSRGGNGGPNTLAGWIINGYDGYLGLGSYYANTGAKFNASQMQAALSARIGTVLMFPVYDTLTGNGANAQYDIIGWVGFHLNSFDARGSSGNLYGYFTQITWTGLAAAANSNVPDFGARTIRLTQ